VTKRHRLENPENLSDADLLAKVKVDNDARERRLIDESHGNFLPGPGRDVQKMLCYLRQLCVEFTRLIPAELDYEAMRAEQMDAAEEWLEKAKAKGHLITPPDAATGLKIVGGS
jgi:hypothetical protein